MPKKFIRRLLPDPHTVKNHRALKIFGHGLHHPNLWALNRRSASGAFAVGLFIAFVPLPSQMLMAAGLAIVFRVNLPLSVALVWLTNPLTMPFFLYICYKIGTWLLQIEPQKFYFELTWTFLRDQFYSICLPLLMGSLICAIVSAIVGYLSVYSLWSYSIRRHWRKRHDK